MENILWSMGYGIYEGLHPDRAQRFRKRLLYIRRAIDKPITLIDIREKGSGSRNGWRFAQGQNGMCWLASSLREKGIGYQAEPALYNEWGGAKWQLKKYDTELRKALICLDSHLVKTSVAFWRVKERAEEGSLAVVLLCGCKEAFKKNGTTWNCHRVPLSEALVKELGEDWKAVHL